MSDPVFIARVTTSELERHNRAISTLRAQLPTGAAEALAAFMSAGITGSVSVHFNRGVVGSWERKEHHKPSLPCRR